MMRGSDTAANGANTDEKPMRNINTPGEFSDAPSEPYGMRRAAPIPAAVWAVMVILGVCVLLCLVTLAGLAVYAAAERKDCKDEKSAAIDLYTAQVKETAKLGQWSKITPVGGSPTARLSHAAVAVGNDMYIHGGFYGNHVSEKVFNDLWKYNEPSDSWTELTTTGDVPSPRLHHSLVKVSSTKLLLFGGFNEFNWNRPTHSGLDDLYELDLTTMKWTRKTATGAKPTPRGAHECIWTNDAMYLFGGYPEIFGDHHAEFLKYDLAQNTWTNLTLTDVSHPNFPGGRIGFTWAEIDGLLYMWGGGCEAGSHTHTAGQCQDMWTYSPMTNAWAHRAVDASNAAFVPKSRRATHGDASVGGVLYLFGGVHVDNSKTPPAEMFDDFHAYIPSENKWYPVNPNWGVGDKPPKTFGHSAVQLGSRLVIFGGRVGVPSSFGSAQLWEYTPVPMKA